MNLFRPLRGGALCALFLSAGLGLVGCLNPPEYPVVPSIEFSSVKNTYVPAAGVLVARNDLVMEVSFRDGDGDLGLSPADITMAPYNAPTGGPNNRGYQYNYLIQPLVKDATTGRFVPVVFGTKGEYDGRYPRLDGAEAKPAPLKGDLRYAQTISLDGVFRAGQVIRFEISILDRALHQSNTVTTSDITLGP